jgi:hypothetical protein
VEREGEGGGGGVGGVRWGRVRWGLANVTEVTVSY